MARTPLRRGTSLPYICWHLTIQYTSPLRIPRCTGRCMLGPYVSCLRHQRDSICHLRYALMVYIAPQHAWLVACEQGSDIMKPRSATLPSIAAFLLYRSPDTSSSTPCSLAMPFRLRLSDKSRAIQSISHSRPDDPTVGLKHHFHASSRPNAISLGFACRLAVRATSPPG